MVYLMKTDSTAPVHIERRRGMRFPKAQGDLGRELTVPQRSGRALRLSIPICTSVNA